MQIRTSLTPIAALLLIGFFGSGTPLNAQEPTASPIPASTASPKPIADSNSVNSSESHPSTAPAPEPDLWHRETMTGDWGGTRSRWKEKGVDLEFKFIGFYQHIASGGTNNNTSYTGKLETTWKFD